MTPNRPEGGTCHPLFDIPKDQAAEPALTQVGGEKTARAAAPETPGPQAAAPLDGGEAPAPAYGPAAPKPGGKAWPRWMLAGALLSWLWGWAYIRWFLMGLAIGPVFMALFCAAFFAGVEGMCRAAARPAPRESRLWLALWALLAADVTFKSACLYYNDAVSGWEMWALHLAAAYWVLARAGALTEGRTGPFLPLDALRALVTVPFGNFFLRLRVLFGALAGWLRGLAGRGKGGVWAGLATLCAAAPVLALAAWLLAGADAAFGAALENFWRWFTLPQGVRAELEWFLVGLPVGAYLFGLAAGALKDPPDPARGQKLRARAEKARLAPAGALAACLALLLALYVAFFAVQLNYLTGGFFGRLPEGFTAAGYARRGFFELCAIVVLNFSVLAAAAKTSRVPLRQCPALKWLAAALCGSNLLFAAVGASKMFLYIRRFGFTPSRVVSGWFIRVLALLSALALASVFRPFPAARAAAAVFCGLFLALCLSQPDLWLRAANRQLVAAGVLEEEDVGIRLLYMPPGEGSPAGP